MSKEGVGIAGAQDYVPQSKGTWTCATCNNDISLARDITLGVAINFSQVTGVAIILPWSNLQSHHRCI